MPVSVVVGGQFGSEGKGKVAHAFARSLNASVVVRTGGSNSGHTVIDANGKPRIFRHLPTAAILPSPVCVIGAGTYIDADVLLKEIKDTGLTEDRLLIDPNAVIVTEDHKRSEIRSGLKKKIGSTGSGTGAAIVDRIGRQLSVRFADTDERIKKYVRPTKLFLRERLGQGERILIEGTQGFGLSLLHSDHYPYVTSRDTTAATFVSEAGLSPLDVDDVILVIRAFPIRVAGDSGPLPNEIDWQTITRESGYKSPLVERTSVTGKVRRVARFDAEIVRAAIEANTPTRLIVNHLDYVDATCRNANCITELGRTFLTDIEKNINFKIASAGVSPNSVLSIASSVQMAI